MELIGFIVGLGGLAFGFWQYFESRKSHFTLVEKLDSVPIQISQIINSLSKSNAADKKIEVGQFSSQVIDIDNDGAPELLIDYPAGAHVLV